MTKPKTPRDGWDGRLFRKLREARGRSIEWLGVKTGVTGRMIAKYESNEVFPPHRWRDSAALALNLKRRDLGVEGE